jgi:feruloyl esterase
MKHHFLQRLEPLKKIPGAVQIKLTSRMSRVGFVIALCLIEPVFAAAHNVPNSPNRPDASECAALMELNLEDAPGGPAFITSAQVVDVPTTGLDRPTSAPSGYGSTRGQIESHIHQYCDVTGYVAPQNRFELKLPLPADWNQNFFFTACGGFCGSLDGRRCSFALARGYASVTGNGGHESSGVGFDAIWAANAPNLQEDFGWRSNHVVTLVTKVITTHFYGKPIRHSYMAGNSKGGQAVLLEAQRFPEDFDGLMPSAPVYDYTGRSVIAAAWFAQAISDGQGGSVLNAAAAEAVHRSVLKHCGAQAGVEEGLVSDPPSCKWQPEMIACPQGSSPDCLNAKQVAAVKRLMTPATNSKGEVLYSYPYIPGTETQWVGWNFFGAPASGLRPRVANLYLPEQYLKYLADEKIRENANPIKFDFDRDPPTLARARNIYDASSFDLRSFKARGGKILLWHGWADGSIMATSSIGYYEEVMKFMGGRKQTEDFFRLFLIPGVHHGGGGPGLTEFDSLTALENWVENGRAPEKLIASRSVNGVIERSRPVFPYPVLARYSGKGDPKQAESFVPSDLSQH